MERFAWDHDPDPGHARQVAKVSLALFDALADVHRLDEGARSLLHAAALLHDVGYARGAESHHKASRDLILASNLDAYTPRDLAIIACVARYHRKALPDPRHRVYRELDEHARDIVLKLAAILRVADGLDRSHLSSVKSVRAECLEGVVRVRVDQSPATPTDIEAALKKSDLFEKVFGVQLEFV